MKITLFLLTLISFRILYWTMRHVLRYYGCYLKSIFCLAAALDLSKAVAGSVTGWTVTNVKDSKALGMLYTLHNIILITLKILSSQFK